MSNDLFYLDPNPDANQVVLLLHGLGANSSSWTLQFEALKEMGFRAIAVDVPGFGKSKYDGDGWNFKRIASHIADLINNLHTGPVHVVGLSMGGVIAQQFAFDHPKLIKKLVLVSTFAVLRPGSISEWLYFIRRAIVVHTLGLDTQAKIVSNRVFPHPDQEVLRKMVEEQISLADSRAYRAAMRNLGLFDSRRQLKKIAMPTLIVSGGDDSTVSVNHQALLAKMITGAKHVVIPGAGHAVTIDHYESFNSILLEFLGG